jgi:methyl-accepting chemotaxis protein
MVPAQRPERRGKVSNTASSNRKRVLPRLSLAGRFALCLVVASLIGIAATTLSTEQYVRGSLNRQAEDGWVRSTLQLASAVAGAIKWKKADVIAESYAYLVNEESQPVARALTFAQGGEQLSAFELPGTDTAAIDAAVLEVVKAGSAGVTTLAVAGHVLIVAPAGQNADNVPLGYLALAWRTDRLQAMVADVRLQLVLIQGLAMLAIVGVVLYAMRRWITRPLGAITGRIDGLAGGDFETPVAGQERNDETGVIARALEAFRQTSIARLTAEGDAEEQRQLIDQERATSEHDRILTTQRQAAVVDEVGRGLSEIANGNLTFELSRDFPEEYRQIGADYHEATARLRDTMSSIIETGEGIRSSSVEFRQAADDLAERTEQQVANLEETVAALDQITSVVTRTAQSAGSARSVAASARTDAEKSGEVAREAMAAMSQIEQSSNQIIRIIGVMDEIAFQTNLLALNAGVEAARAGDAGRGFAVVASEVHTLAQRSADAAKEIKALVSASATQVGRGVTMVGQTANVLERIVEHVNDINKVVNDIASGAEEQAAGLQAINGAMNTMDQVTQKNAAMVEEATASSISLSEDIDRLVRLIRRFKVSDDEAAEEPARSDEPGNLFALPRSQRLAAATA